MTCVNIAIPVLAVSGLSQMCGPYVAVNFDRLRGSLIGRRYVGTRLSFSHSPLTLAR